MAKFTLEDFTNSLTTDEVKTSIYSVLAQLGVTTTHWKPGGVVRTMIAACAVILAAFSKLIAFVARMGFLELSSGAWLTLKARYDYGVERIDATYASGTLTLNNSSGGTYTKQPGEFIATNPTTGKTYTNTAVFTLNALQVGLDIPIQASDSGSASTALAGAITQTNLLGVTSTNAAALIGIDEESDADLRVRCTAKLGSLSPGGPKDAYDYAARNAVRSDGSAIGITRTRLVRSGSPSGTVTVYVATASGGVTGTMLDTATDLGAVHQAIQDNAVPQCVDETTTSASEVIVPITYTARIYQGSGFTDAQLKSAIAAELTDLFATLPIGGNEGFLKLKKIEGRILEAQASGVDLGIFDVTVSTPSGDTALSVSQVAKLGAITATIVQVAKPGG